MHLEDPNRTCVSACFSACGVSCRSWASIFVVFWSSPPIGPSYRTSAVAPLGGPPGSLSRCAYAVGAQAQGPIWPGIYSPDIHSSSCAGQLLQRGKALVFRSGGPRRCHRARSRGRPYPVFINAAVEARGTHASSASGWCGTMRPIGDEPRTAAGTSSATGPGQPATHKDSHYQCHEQLHARASN